MPTSKNSTAKKDNSSVKTTSTNNTNNSTNHAHIHKPKMVESWWIYVIIIMLSVYAVAGIATLLGGNMFNFNGYIMPTGIAPKIVFPIAWAVMYTLLGISGCFVFLSPNQTDKTKWQDIMWFSINLFLNMLWPLFFYRLNWLIFSTILNGIIVITAIITNIRFYYRNLVGGILYSIYTAWLLYAFYVNLATCLINV